MRSECESGNRELEFNDFDFLRGEILRKRIHVNLQLEGSDSLKMLTIKQFHLRINNSIF